MITRLVSLLCVLLLGGFLAGCGGSAEDSAGQAASAPMSANEAASQGDSGAASQDGDGAARSNAVQPADVAKAAAAPGAGVTRLVRTAEVTVEVKDVSAAARTIRTAAVSLGGIVSNETTSLPADSEDSEDSDSAGQTSELTLRVPEPKMDDALSRIAAVGKERNLSTTSEDVTATIVDLDSRVATQTKSVARVRVLLDRASSLQDVVLLESELARREADLESIQARQRALADKAALATITVSLHSPGAKVAEPAQAGFLSGLDGGWTALKASTTVVLTVLGYLLPVCVVIAIVGVPAYLLRRRFRHQAPDQTPPAASPAANPAPAPVP